MNVSETFKKIVATIGLEGFLGAAWFLIEFYYSDASFKDEVSEDLAVIKALNFDNIDDNAERIEMMYTEVKHVDNFLHTCCQKVERLTWEVDMLRSQLGMTRANVQEAENIRRAFLERDSLRSLLKKKVQPIKPKL